jgi:tRNA (guanosine-2'-O-)-methyltransferase
MKRFVPEFRTDERKDKIRRVLEKRQTNLTVVLENVHDPHNVSAVIRTCDAVGILDVNFIYYGGQVFPKLGDKSSASAKKWVKVNRFESVKDCYDELRGQGKTIYTTNMTRESKSLFELDLTVPVALVFGNEHLGVSEEASNLADGNFLIPQVGVIQSLNISVACAVSLFEAFRQKLAKGDYEQAQLEEERLKNLLNEWLSK